MSTNFKRGSLTIMTIIGFVKSRITFEFL